MGGAAHGGQTGLTLAGVQSDRDEGKHTAIPHELLILMATLLGSRFVFTASMDGTVTGT
jgi:hypothetical protein